PTPSTTPRSRRRCCSTRTAARPKRTASSACARRSRTRARRTHSSATIRRQSPSRRRSRNVLSEVVRRLVLAIALVFAAVSPALGEPPDTHEVLSDRPSGFWTSNRPAVGGAYRYRLLGIGLAIALGTGWLTWRLIRKANAERARR